MELQVEEPAEEKNKEITLQSLLSNGAHYGHSTSSWCPKMAPFLYGTKSIKDKKLKSTKDVYIFNLDLTLQLWNKARDAVIKNAASGGSMLFVGTKPQSSSIIEREALRSDSNYVCHKWVGGLLTNFHTLQQSIAKMQKLEDLLTAREDPDSDINFTKKEALLKNKELGKLMKKFGGVRSMRKPPALMFVSDVSHNHVAVQEARLLKIPVIGIVDSNADPDNIDYVIPANDDATGTLDLIISNVADAVLEGKALLKEKEMLASEGADTKSETEDGGGGTKTENQQTSDPGITVVKKSTS